MARYKKREPAIFEAARIELPFDMAILGDKEFVKLEQVGYRADGSVVRGVTILTSGGDEVTVREGAWVVRGRGGKLFTMDNESFQATFEAVD